MKCPVRRFVSAQRVERRARSHGLVELSIRGDVVSQLCLRSGGDLPRPAPFGGAWPSSVLNIKTMRIVTAVVLMEGWTTEECPDVRPQAVPTRVLEWDRRIARSHHSSDDIATEWQPWVSRLCFAERIQECRARVLERTGGNDDATRRFAGAYGSTDHAWA